MPGPGSAQARSAAALDALAGMAPFQEDQEDRAGGQPDTILNEYVHYRFAPFLYLNWFIMGNRFLKSWRSPGPAATTSIDGKMKKKMGKTSFAPTLPARSSASWRLLTRRKSEWLRRDSPMLVPKRS